MSNPRTPPAPLANQEMGYPARRSITQPNDAAMPYDKPPVPGMPDSLQMTAPAPPRPGVPGPGPEHFNRGTIRGESAKNARS